MAYNKAEVAFAIAGKNVAVVDGKHAGMWGWVDCTKGSKVKVICAATCRRFWVNPLHCKVIVFVDC